MLTDGVPNMLNHPEDMKRHLKDILLENFRCPITTYGFGYGDSNICNISNL